MGDDPGFFRSLSPINPMTTVQVTEPLVIILRVMQAGQGRTPT